MVKSAVLGITDEDRATIGQAITRAEAHTSGEIFVVVSRRSADYVWVFGVYAALAALLIPTALVLFLGLDPVSLGASLDRLQAGGWEIGLGATPKDEATAGLLMIVTLQALIMSAISALGLSVNLRRILVPSWIKRQRVHQAACDQFSAHGLHHTSGKTGVLIYVSLAEQQAEIIADKAIHAKVAAQTWSPVLGRLVLAAREGNLVAGLVISIEECGTLLANHFPRSADDKDELPNRIVVI